MTEWVEVQVTVPAQDVVTLEGEIIHKPEAAYTEWHTEQCVREERERTEARALWVKRWPYHCSNCEGEGEFSHSGSWWEPPGSDPCHVCQEQGKCPRCGHYIPAHLGLDLLVEQVLDELDLQVRLYHQNGYWNNIYIEDEPFNIWLEKQLPCPICGWNWLKGYDDMMPPPPECCCWIRDDYPGRYEREELSFPLGSVYADAVLDGLYDEDNPALELYQDELEEMARCNTSG